MKFFFSFFLIGFFSFAGFVNLRFAQAELVAPVYPGSVAADHEIPEYLSEYVSAFYSADPIEKVVEFYKGRLGDMEEVRQGREYNYTVKRIRVGKAALQPDRLGVMVKTKKPDEDPRQQYAGVEQDIHMASYQHDYFRPLEALVARLSGRDWEDYNEAVDRFIHLTWSYFPDSGRTDSRGREMNLARALIEDYHKGGSMEEMERSSEEMAARMQELMQQGRISEVQALAEQMRMQAVRATEDDDSKWDQYISVLEEIENHAFKTLITIHRDVKE